MWEDLRFAFRSLRKRPAFSLLAAITVALGVGINVAMFTIAYGVLWRPFPYPESDRLVKFSELSASGTLNTSYQNAQDWKSRSGAFEDIALERPFPSVTVRLPESVENLVAGFSHRNLFSVLRVQPVLGRLFTDQEDSAGGEAAAVITDRAWERYFGRDPAVIGRRVRALVAMEGTQADSIVVVGVLPPGFFYDNREIWLPLNRFWGQIDASRGNHWFSSIGRLRPGVSLARAQADLTAISKSLEQEFPSSNQGVRAIADTMGDYAAGSLRTPLILLLASVGFVLLIACSNVVHLVLTRTMERSREIAIRLALGANRSKLLRLLLSESLLIVVIGGAAGMVLSYWAVAWVIAAQPGLLPRATTIHVDRAAAMYALGLMGLTLLILASAPAWFSARRDVREALQTAGRGGVSRRRQLLGWGLVAAEVSMASVLLTGAGLMIQTLRHLSQVNLGYEPKSVLALDFSFSPFQLQNHQEVIAASDRLLNLARNLPGVSSAGFATPFHIGGNGMLPPVSIEGKTNSSTLPMVPVTSVSADLFQTLQIPLREGRHFDRLPSGNPKVMVSEEFARRFFPGESALGKRIVQGEPREIIGVVGNSRLQGAITKDLPEVYWQGDPGWDYGTLLVRVDGPPGAALATLRERIKREEPLVRMGTGTPLSVSEDRRVALPRFTRGLLLVFAGLAVVLAILGIYGVATYSVVQRHKEIGVRIALGASVNRVAGMILRQTLGAALLGGALGAVGSGLLARLLASQFYGVSATDPLVVLGVGGLIALAAAGASAVPVWRAARIDPMVSLRQD